MMQIEPMTDPVKKHRIKHIIFKFGFAKKHYWTNTKIQDYCVSYFINGNPKAYHTKPNGHRTLSKDLKEGFSSHLLSTMQIKSVEA